MKFTTAGEIARRTPALMGHAKRRENAVSELPLALQRRNWAITELELDRLRDRVARFVDLPAFALPKHRASLA